MTSGKWALKKGVAGALSIILVIMTVTAGAQDHLKSMPGYDRYQKMSKEISGSFKPGTLIGVKWQEDGQAFSYQKDGKTYRYDIATLTATETGATSGDATGQGGRGRGGRQGGGPARGRQFDSAASPDGRLKAFYRDRNLWLSDTSGSNEVAITTDGSEKTRIKNGVASWVYGEELAQVTAMWWSPNSKKVAYYRFDESPVPDYYLQMDQTKLQSKVDVEAYPKAGVPNPIVDLFIYDVDTKESVKVDVRDGKPFDNSVVGHYVYNVGWSADGTELLFNRSNRRQNVMEITAANPASGKCRVVVHDEWLPSWTENRPNMQFLKDGKRFILESERNGWKNFYLYDLSGKLLNPITSHQFEVANIVRVDESTGTLYYTARDGDNFLKLQLHRVGLDGKGDKRLTDPAFNHSVQNADLAPDGRHFIDVSQTHDIPPTTRLMDANGKQLAELATSDMTKFNQLGLKKAEMFHFKAADGQTNLLGLISFPSNFDPSKKYPILVSVYGGPASASNVARETFVAPLPTTEYGFLVVNVDSRAVPGMGKRVLDSIYLKLGVVEMDDMAEGIKSLWSRPYVDKNRVGIYGTSYGGYTSVMSILRHPDVFQAASASSPPTAWYHYDSIYTERYMWIPQENKEGYEAGNAMNYVDKLKGRLMIYYGTADNNVHPSNSMQLIEALQKAGKSFDVQVGPDQGHSGLNQQRMMEFFIENLVIRPSEPTGQAAN